jgi:hypothetical protein
MKYHRARLDHTCVSLRSFLETYQTNEYDEAHEDPVTYMTQDEFFKDAQSTMNVICCPKNLPFVATIMRECPVICRTLAVSRTVVPGIKMNPWLNFVSHMPNIVRYVSTADFLRFKGSWHGSEFINGAMLVTKNPSGSILAYGVGKHIQSYLLCGTDEVFHPDADLATWAMVVCYIMAQPECKSWMTEELENITFMHGAVYGEPDTSWRKYLATVRSPDFSLALVTQSRHLERWLQCPHLNKFLLACFLLKDELSAEELQARRDAAVREFFGRQCKPKLLSFMFESKWEAQLNELFNSLPFELKPTLCETIRALTRHVYAYPWNTVPIKLKEPTQHTCRLVHLNTSCAGIVGFFDKLKEGIPALDDQRWFQLFTHGMSVPDSYKRNTDASFDFDRDKLVRDIRNKLRLETIDFVPRYTLLKFQEGMLDAHRDPPVLITKNNRERFKQQHGRDLGEELNVNDFGLSLTACMCPKCPLFKKNLGSKTSSELPIFQLMEHTASFVPKVDNVPYVHVLFRHMADKKSEFVNVLNTMFRDGDGMGYEEFERLFV